MRVKIGNTWYECTIDQPIMVELTPTDRELISNMHADATKYAVFDDNSKLSQDEKRQWMKS